MRRLRAGDAGAAVGAVGFAFVLDLIRIFRYALRMKTQTIEVDDDTAAALKQRAEQRGVSVPELVAELVTLDMHALEADSADISELDRRWKSYQAQKSVTSNDDVVRWLRTWGTPTFRRWRDR